MNDDDWVRVAGQLTTEISPGRDLWPDIAAGIENPARRRWMPMLAQAAAVVLLVGGSSVVTYMTMKNNGPESTVIASTYMIFEQASFGNRYSLGPDFQDARNMLVAELDVEVERLPPAARQDIASNLQLVRDTIFNMNQALEDDPENLILQGRLLQAYRDELALLSHITGLTRNVMMRNDI